MSQKVNEEELFRKLVVGKRVALVGPGRTTTENITKIEECDTVVRCGAWFHQKDPIHYGVRTDIVYNVFDNHPSAGGNAVSNINDWKHGGVKLLCCSLPNNTQYYNSTIKPVVDHAKNFFPVRNINSTVHDFVQAICYSKPNGGFSALIDLIASKPKHLYIVGIDCHRSLINSNYPRMSNFNHSDLIKDMRPGERITNHDPNKQYALLKCMYKNIPFLEFDPHIVSFFENPDYDTIG